MKIDFNEYTKIVYVVIIGLLLNSSLSAMESEDKIEIIYKSSRVVPELIGIPEETYQDIRALVIAKARGNESNVKEKLWEKYRSRFYDRINPNLTSSEHAGDRADHCTRIKIEGLLEMAERFEIK